MTLIFFGPSEPDPPIPYEWPVHNLAEVTLDGREVQATVGKRTYKIASVEHYGEHDRHVRYVISDNGWFVAMRRRPEYGRLAYAGICVRA